MRIAVNLRPYVTGEIGGIENYVRHVVFGIARHQELTNEEWVVFARTSQVEEVREIAPGARVIPVNLETAAEEIENELRRGNYDVLFCPLMVLNPLKPPCPCALTIPDLHHEFHPGFFETLRPSISNADVIFTLSNYSKSAIIDKFGVESNKIVVAGLDVDDEFCAPPTPETEAAFRALNLFDRYIFYPANFSHHKNHSTLLEAMGILVRKGHSSLGLVFTRAHAEGATAVRKQISALGLADNVRILDYQSRAVIAEIYRHSQALAFVSRSEGFGIPILEAFHSRAPVVSSSCCSCPEVCGGAALLVDELDARSIAQGIERILTNGELRSELIAKGLERKNHYLWKHTVDLTLKSLEDVAREARTLSVAEVDEHPIVSIVTPSFNMARFIEETISSVLSQDYPHIDYIVEDGGSSDGTMEILRKYEGRLRYHSRPDRGQADAINRGFAESRGPVFTFLNADDTYLPGAVGTAVRHMLAHKNAGVVYGEAYHVHEGGQIIDRYPTQPFDFHLLARNCFICQPASFMWGDAFRSIGRMNIDLQYALDYDLWLRMAKRYSFVKIDDYLATSRMYRENKTLGKRRDVYMEILSTVKAHYGYIPHDWVYGYSCYLIDRKDQFFEPLKPSHFKVGLSLILGSYYNRAEMRRYWKEWSSQLGLAERFRKPSA